MVNIDPSWPETMDIPWSDMPSGLKMAIKDEKRPAPNLRKKMVRSVVDAMLKHHPNPNRSQTSTVAKRIVRQHPNSFEDRTDEGERMGTGYYSLVSQLKNRIENVNRENTLARLRKPRKQTAEVSIPKTPADAYGCVSWQPVIPEGVTEEALLAVKKIDDIYKQGLTLTQQTYSEIQQRDDGHILQRKCINATPSPSMQDIHKEWPFLFWQRWLLVHFKTLTDVPLNTKLMESFASKGHRILAFFKSLDSVSQRGKNVHKVLRQMEEAAGLVENADDVFAPGIIFTLMANFREDPKAMFLLADVSCTTAILLANYDDSICSALG